MWAVSMSGLVQAAAGSAAGPEEGSVVAAAAVLRAPWPRLFVGLHDLGVDLGRSNITRGDNMGVRIECKLSDGRGVVHGL